MGGLVKLSSPASLATTLCLHCYRRAADLVALGIGYHIHRLEGQPSSRADTLRSCRLYLADAAWSIVGSLPSQTCVRASVALATRRTPGRRDDGSPYLIAWIALLWGSNIWHLRDLRTHGPAHSAHGTSRHRPAGLTSSRASSLCTGRFSFLCFRCFERVNAPAFYTVFVTLPSQMVRLTRSCKCA